MVAPVSWEVKVIDTVLCSAVKAVNLQLRLQSRVIITARAVPVRKSRAAGRAMAAVSWGIHRGSE